MCLKCVIVKPRKMRRPRPPRGCRAMDKENKKTDDNPWAANPPWCNHNRCRFFSYESIRHVNLFPDQPLVLYSCRGGVLYNFLQPVGFVSRQQNFRNLLTMACAEACWKEMYVRLGMGIWQMKVDLLAWSDGWTIYSHCVLLAITGGNRKCACHITCVFSLLAALVMLMDLSLL
jgi:hypothetical protein